MKYKCKKCKKEIELLNQTLVIKDNQVIIKEAFCCRKQMECKTKSEGFPSLIRTEETLKKN
tara:strand:+ start:94 stop:276 length:183 start_codon:yes stop_codon:yes gene_type:complete